MRKIFIVVILLLVSILHAATIVKSVRREDYSKIRYYHNIKNEKNDTLLLVIQGGACISVFHQLDTRLLLEKLNFNADVLWVEKYGLTNESAQSVCPKEYVENNSPLHRLDDYLQVLNSLENQYQKIIVVGAQEGAAIASLLLADENMPITAGIVINSGGGSYANDAIWQIEKQPAEVIENDHPVISRFLEQAKQGDLPKNINFQNHGYRWWYEMLNTNMYETLKKSKKPLLIVQGLADREIALDNSQTMYDCLTNK
ncbi:MAG: hypothetical protein ACRCXK_10200, partial [Wohlfahrtiimonas sp.]